MFNYDFDFRTAKILVTDQVNLYVQAKVLSRAANPIAIGGTEPGSVNLGFRILDNATQGYCFEDRASMVETVLEPNKWTKFELSLSYTSLGDDKTSLLLDFVCENEYWFHERDQNICLLTIWTNTRMVDPLYFSSQVQTVIPTSERQDVVHATNFSRNHDDLLESAGISDHITTKTGVFDVSDLMQFWRHNIRPTGIQRVQIEVIKAVILNEATSPGVTPGGSLIFYDEGSHEWNILDNPKVLTLIAMSYQPAISKDYWNSELEKALALARPYHPGRDNIIINLGSSWWIPDYLYKMRLMRLDYRIGYVPFIHDAIPLMASQYCASGLVDEFRLWFRGAVSAADHIIVNSKYSAEDVRNCAKQLVGYCPPISVARLNAAFPVSEARGHGIVQRLNLDVDQFAICVGTLEARKNHALLFEVWNELHRRIPQHKMPKLVLVGKEGWMFELAQAVYNRYPVLKDYVIKITDISDTDLAELYRRSTVNLYPSFYEGWGLPVTEAASYGRLTVASKVSSIPEAASKGDILLDPNNVDEWTETLFKLFTDSEFLRSCEERSRKGANLRQWRDVATDILFCLADSASFEHSDVIPYITEGVIYDFRVTTARKAFDNCAMQFRSGNGWHHLEDWGAWSAPGITELKFRLSSPGIRYLYITAVGAAEELSVTITMDRKIRVNRNVTAFERVILRLEIDTEDVNEHVARIVVHNPIDLALKTDGKDTRHVGLGFINMMCALRDDFGSRLNFTEAMQMHFIP